MAVTFDYVDNRTHGKQQNLYVGNEIKQLDADGLKSEFNASDNDELRKAFGTFDNYLNYMTERQDLIDSGLYNAAWFDIGDNYDNRPNAVQALDNEDLTVRPGTNKAQGLSPKAELKQSAQKSAYNQWQNSPENQELMAKYGLNKPMSNQDGDLYTWNGSSYVKTKKVDDHLSVGDYIQIAGGLAAAAAFAPVATGLLGIPAGTTAATVANSAIGSAISQGVTTGSIDPTQVLAAAATAGINPGGMLTPEGMNPNSFLAGAIKGGTNSAFSNAIATGNFDPEAVLTSAALQGTGNVITDFLGDTNQYSYDKLQEKYILEGFSPEQASQLALNNPLLNTSDLAGLVGETGLLAPLGLDGRVSTEWLQNLNDNYFLGVSGQNAFQDVNGNVYTANELVSQGIDPATIGYTPNADGFSIAGQFESTPTILGKVFDAAGNAIEAVGGDFLDVLSASQIKNKYGFDPRDPANKELLQQLSADGFRFDENYTFSDSKRSNDVVFSGTAAGFLDKYSTGPDWQNILSDVAVYAPTNTNDGKETTNIPADAIINLTEDGDVVLPGGSTTTLDDFISGLINGAENNNTGTSVVDNAIPADDQLTFGGLPTVNDITQDTTLPSGTIEEDTTLPSEEEQLTFGGLPTPTTVTEDVVLPAETTSPTTETTTGSTGSISKASNNNTLNTNFNPFLSGISYNALQIPGIRQGPQKDYVAELDNLINRSLFEGMI